MAGLALAHAACADEPACRAGMMRACTIALDGGGMQNGFQACGADRTWSDCVGTGACTGPGGTALSVYSRCASADECGGSGCAACSSYAGVQNPSAYSVCYPFCQIDADCAPTSASTNVVPRCLLGACALLCQTGSACPNDSQCLPWADAATAAMFPGSDGLCE
jgi:hypothetical protein